MSFLRLIALRLHPADAAVVGILLVAVATSAFAGDSPALHELLWIHLALLVGYLLFLAALRRWGRIEWVACVRPIVSMEVIWTLYMTLGWLGMAAMPFRADATLLRLDTLLFAGANPTFLAQRFQTTGRVEFFAFFYGLFIPYINVSLILGSIGRPLRERNAFLTGWVFTYCISYLGYIFLPAQGPGGFLAHAYALPLRGGAILRIVERSVTGTGGLRGAFPSLHVGSALYLCLFDFRTNRLRGMIFLPIVLLIYVATIVLRYHYVVDLIAGTLISVSCLIAGPVVYSKWADARRAAGLSAADGT